MKLFVLPSAAAVLVISGFAQASVVTITGAEAEKMMIEMSNANDTVVIENTVGITVLQNGKTECTLIGSHGGSPRAQDPIFSCQILK